MEMTHNLQRADTTQDLSQLLQALHLENQLSRQTEVAEILKSLSEDKAVSLLFAALLKSPDSESRERIVQELAKIGSHKAVELLESIMTDDFDPKVQHEAIRALKQVGSDKAIDVLLLALRSSNDWLRQEAASALGDFKADRVVDGLIEASKHYYTAYTAVRSLIQIGSDRAIEGLVKIIQEPMHLAGTTSYDALEGLVRLGTEKAIDEIFKAWSATDSIHRSRLFGILYQSKPKHLIAPLCERLQNNSFSSDDREKAAEMLGIIGTENEIPLLESIWRDWSDESNREISWRALRAAEQISHRALKLKAEREHALEETRAFVAHEFRHALTPLNAYVKMLDETLSRPELDKERLLSLTSRICKQTGAAFALVDQYMDYSRPLSPQFAQTDINNLLEESLEEFKAELENRKIVLHSQFVQKANAEVDKQMLTQVLRNVIANAIQSVDKEGSLVVATQLDKNNVIIAISDTGTGVKPEHLLRIFDIGFTTKSDRRGAGVGLALSKRIVEEAHNGSIAVANNTDSTGATVIISLPKKQTEMKNGRHDLALADR
jgi:signal transduction histidine kinase